MYTARRQETALGRPRFQQVSSASHREPTPPVSTKSGTQEAQKLASFLCFLCRNHPVVQKARYSLFQRPGIDLICVGSDLRRGEPVLLHVSVGYDVGVIHRPHGIKM